MYSRAGWYARMSLGLVAAVAVGAALTYLIHPLPWPALFIGMLDTCVWVLVGSSLAGPWSYENYVHQHEIVQRLRRRAHRHHSA